ncbi:hypothetical protein N7539_000627 [Penicillium diatomitis]|uniref:Uncharacterized protein n=1 Tax=Penicillium diatomitis TaxID=2819901 RepID=A0A9W9XM38_9EURO|nr:uncharacterized protein N7539_000627 [Penicillium diatomitis]KAJ5495511.1 hypothetical protein N7539_000627 [Penicillium diatomitis]
MYVTPSPYMIYSSSISKETLQRESIPAWHNTLSRLHHRARRSSQCASSAKRFIMLKTRKLEGEDLVLIVTEHSDWGQGQVSEKNSIVSDSVWDMEEPSTPGEWDEAEIHDHCPDNGRTGEISSEEGLISQSIKIIAAKKKYPQEVK